MRPGPDVTPKVKEATGADVAKGMQRLVWLASLLCGC